MKLPDGPQAPVWLETLQFVLRPIEYLEARQKRYGDAFTIGRNTDSPVVYLSHPQAIEEIFTADRNLFDVGRGSKPLLEPLLGEQSLGVLDGQSHQRLRRLLLPPFHGERMRAYSQLISKIAQQVLSGWTIGKAFPVRSSMQEITLRVILQAIFGINQGQRYDLLRELLSTFVDSISSPLNAAQLFFPAMRQDLGAWSPWGQFVRLRKQIIQLLIDEIEERRQQPIEEERTDILTLLLMTVDETGQPLTDAELRDQLLTLLFTGHETTATALAWALYWIHYLPEVKSKLLDEIGTIDADADLSAIARLPYLTAVVSETLRIYPVGLATPSRILNSPLQIGDFQFNPGTVLVPCIYLTHQREDLYPEPKHFQPERFLERQFSPYEYFPFGGGNRSCIGMAFAQFQMKLVLATLLRNLDLDLASGHSIKPVRRGPTLAPSDNLHLIVKDRHPVLHQKALAAL
ncbi:MAG TPA: cytochrome P450 [Leptolyngbyaceae cyanobacterium]